MKRFGCITLALIALLCIGLWQLHHYLASRRVAAEVSSRLEAVLGIPVRVARVDAGVRTSALYDVELFEPGTDTSSAPWAIIERADVDLRSWDLARGRDMPRGIALHGVTLVLRHDLTGQPVTRLPRPDQIVRSLPQRPGPSRQRPGVELPRITIVDARLVYRQPNHRDLVIGGIRGELVSRDGRPTLEGSVNDPRWGEWRLSGRMDTDSRACSAELRSLRPVPLDRESLDQVPFVDRSLWDQVQVQGETPAEIGFAFDAATQTVRYHATLEPTALFLRVPRYDLRMEHVHGKITVENNLIHLDALHGHVAGGEIDGKGELRFFNTVLQLQVRVDVCGLRTRQLPKEWTLPPEVRGLLSGQAVLRTTIQAGQAEFHGEGEGVIADARIAWLPTEPIPVMLTADAGGFHFRLKEKSDSPPVLTQNRK